MPKSTIATPAVNAGPDAARADRHRAAAGSEANQTLARIEALLAEAGQLAEGWLADHPAGCACDFCGCDLHADAEGRLIREEPRGPAARYEVAGVAHLLPLLASCIESAGMGTPSRRTKRKAAAK